MYRYLIWFGSFIVIGCQNTSVKESREYKDLLKEYEVIRDLLYEERDLFDNQVEEYYKHDSRLDEIDKRMEDLIILVRAISDKNGKSSIELYERNNDLRIEIHNLKSKIDRFKKWLPSIEELDNDNNSRALKEINGKILEIKNESKVIIINVGTDNWVKNGNEFTVYRGNKFIARLSVFKASINTSECHILFPSKLKDQLMKGDKVSTIIY